MSNAATVKDFTVGQRVELHPATDLWMIGARYGHVVKITRTRVHVKLDRLPTPRPFHPGDLQVIS